MLLRTIKKDEHLSRQSVNKMGGLHLLKHHSYNVVNFLGSLVGTGTENQKHHQRKHCSMRWVGWLGHFWAYTKIPVSLSLNIVLCECIVQLSSAARFPSCTCQGTEKMGQYVSVCVHNIGNVSIWTCHWRVLRPHFLGVTSVFCNQS